MLFLGIDMAVKPLWAWRNYGRVVGFLRLSPRNAKRSVGSARSRPQRPSVHKATCWLAIPRRPHFAHFGFGR